MIWQYTGNKERHRGKKMEENDTFLKVKDALAVFLIGDIARLFKRNKSLLESWDGFTSHEFIDNMFSIKSNRNQLEYLLGQERAFEEVKGLYLDLFKPFEKK
jgi:hypothetical protein